MTNVTQPKPVRFSASWSTQLRLTQAIGRGLANLVPIKATIVIGERGDGGLENGDVDLKAWGGTVTPMEHTAKSAKERYDAGMLDACFGDGSAYDGTCWKWMAERGYRFLDISEAAMQKLEAQGLRRHITPAGFFPGI